MVILPLKAVLSAAFLLSLGFTITQSELAEGLGLNCRYDQKQVRLHFTSQSFKGRLHLYTQSGNRLSVRLAPLGRLSYQLEVKQFPIEVILPNKRTLVVTSRCQVKNSAYQIDAMQ